MSQFVKRLLIILSIIYTTVSLTGCGTSGPEMMEPAASSPVEMQHDSTILKKEKDEIKKKKTGGNENDDMGRVD